MKKQFKIVCILMLTVFLAPVFSYAQINDACVEQFKSGALTLINQALGNGYDRIEDLSLKKLKAKMEADAVPATCNTRLTISIEGRKSAFYSLGENPKDHSYLVNYIMLTKQGTEAPDNMKGLLFFHEYIGALGFTDYSYTYTLQLYKLTSEIQFYPKKLVSEKSASFLMASAEEGTSTGVGGGDWRTIQLKISLLEKLTSYLQLHSAEISSSEASRRINFFMTLMIDFEADSYFANNPKLYALVDFFEAGDSIHCSKKNGLRIVIRDSVADAFQNPDNLEKLFQFVLNVVGNSDYGSNALCVRKPK